jgi:hypothetical protein
VQCGMRSVRVEANVTLHVASLNESNRWKSKMARGTAARELAICTTSLPPRTDFL